MSLTSIGAKAFRDGVRAQKQPYSIFAIKLSIEDLIPELQNRFQIEEWQQNIDRTGKLGDLVGVPVIKFKDNPWTVVYWSIGRYLDIESNCRGLSWRLNCSSIAIYEVDRSGWVEWKAFRGRDEEDAESVTRQFGAKENEDYAYFESHIRKVPQDLENTEDQTLLKRSLDELIDELLIQEQIQIPSLNLTLDSLEIERVDLLVLPKFPLGINHFQNWIYRGHPEYAIFAVKADIDRVIPVLAKYKKTKEWQNNIRSTASIHSVVTQAMQEKRCFIPIVQPADNPWTIIYWITWEWEDLSGICTQISGDLDTLAISVSEEDTSCAFGYTLFDRGRQIERCEYFEDIFFESEIREEPEFDDFEKSEHETAYQFIHDRFIEEGIYIPSWDLNVSDPWIARLDLLERSSWRMST